MANIKGRIFEDNGIIELYPFQTEGGNIDLWRKVEVRIGYDETLKGGEIVRTKEARVHLGGSSYSPEDAEAIGAAAVLGGLLCRIWLSDDFIARNLIVEATEAEVEAYKAEREAESKRAAEERRACYEARAKENDKRVAAARAAYDAAIVEARKELAAFGLERKGHDWEGRGIVVHIEKARKGSYDPTRFDGLVFVTWPIGQKWNYRRRRFSGKNIAAKLEKFVREEVAA